MPNLLNCHISEASKAHSTKVRVKAGRRVQEAGKRPRPGARTSMTTASGLAEAAPSTSPVPSRAIAVVPPQKGHGTPVACRSRQNVAGRCLMWIAPSASTASSRIKERRATTRRWVLRGYAVHEPTALLLEIVTQLLGPRRVPQLRQRLGLDLPDALPGDAELLADLFESARVTVGQSEPELDDLLLALGERVQDRVELLLQEDERRRVDRDDRVGVFDEVAEVGVVLFADRCFQRHRLLRQLLDLAHPLGRKLHLDADLFRRGFAAQVLQQLTLDAHELVDGLDHVHRDADRARLVCDGARDRLPDPPRRVGRELVALRVVELLDRTDQTEVALLDQVEEQHASTDVALGDRDDESEVGFDEPLLRQLAVTFDELEIAAQPRLQRHVHRQLL